MDGWGEWDETFYVTNPYQRSEMPIEEAISHINSDDYTHFDEVCRTLLYTSQKVEGKVSGYFIKAAIDPEFPKRNLACTTITQLSKRNEEFSNQVDISIQQFVNECDVNPMNVIKFFLDIPEAVICFINQNSAFASWCVSTLTIDNFILSFDPLSDNWTLSILNSLCRKTELSEDDAVSLLNLYKCAAMCSVKGSVIASINGMTNLLHCHSLLAVEICSFLEDFIPYFQRIQFYRVILPLIELFDEFLSVNAEFSINLFKMFLTFTTQSPIPEDRIFGLVEHLFNVMSGEQMEQAIDLNLIKTLEDIVSYKSTVYFECMLNFITKITGLLVKKGVDVEPYMEIIKSSLVSDELCIVRDGITALHKMVSLYGANFQVPFIDIIEELTDSPDPQTNNSATEILKTVCRAS